MRPLSFVLSLALFVVCAHAQSDLPLGAHSDLYFTQVADGGDTATRWQTTFFFVNQTDHTAQGAFYFTDQNGQPMNVTIAGIYGSDFSLTIGPKGSLTFRTEGSGPLQSGWADAHFDTPIQGFAAYRTVANGVPRQETAVLSSLPTPSAFYFANRFTSMAFANIWSNVTQQFQITLLNERGEEVGRRVLSLAPEHQTTAVLSNLFTLTPTFTGSLRVDFDYPGLVLVLNADSSGIFSTMPPGQSAGYSSERHEIHTVFHQVLNTINSIPEWSLGAVSLDTGVDFMGTHGPAYATSDGNIHISYGLVQLFKSPDELASVVAHELGHVYQWKYGYFANANNPELDADIFGLLISIFAGYDPYGTAGAMGKIMMVTGQSSLAVRAWEDQNPTDAHLSFSTRITYLWDTINGVCADASIKPFCESYKERFHPDMPGPLGNPRRAQAMFERHSTDKGSSITLAPSNRRKK